MRVFVVGIGRLRDQAVESLCDEYAKRSRPMLAFERETVRDAAALFEQDAFVVLMDERGVQLTSEGLARRITRWRADGVKRVMFVVGDADGFDDEARAKADLVWSLSKLTLPHRLAHLVLAEQLYRAGTILVGHPYHHT